MLYKRPNSKKWWCKFTAPNGKVIRQSTGTEDRRAAEEYEVKLRADLWRQAKLGDKPQRTWQEACVRWATEMAHKRTLSDDIGIMRQLDMHLKGLTLDGIGKDHINAITDALKAKGNSNGRINRILALVRAILNKAQKDWEWIDRCPAIRRLPEPKGSVNWLTREQAEMLLAELPPHLAAMARFTLATGLRAANVYRLQWADIDLNGRMMWVKPEDSKNAKAIGVPLNADAMAVLRAQQGKHPEAVFTYKGEPVTGKPNNTAWRNAIKRTGLDGICWHSLRHTWASWHVMAGTPLPVLKELGGWSTLDMVMRYAHLGAGQLADHAANINSLNMERDKARKKA